MSEAPEIISLLGIAHYATPATGDALAVLCQQYDEARKAYEASPMDVEALIMYGRRTAYLWRFHDAIRIYSLGIEKYPLEPMLYRHRGHRYISIREFSKARADLERASELEQNSFDIWYHLGLSCWLQGNFEGALRAYQKCYEVTGDNEHKVAIEYWLYLTLRRLGKHSEAAGLLQSVGERDHGENVHYYNILLLFRGEKSEADITGLMQKGGVDHVTMGYGLGLWHLVAGRAREAKRCFVTAVSGTHWPGFGFIAAEVELARGISDQ